jgi:hypothetical protein
VAGSGNVDTAWPGGQRSAINIRNFSNCSVETLGSDFSQISGWGTAVTAVRALLAVLAVRVSAFSEISQFLMAVLAVRRRAFF